MSAASSVMDPELFDATVAAIAEAQERIDGLLEAGRSMPLDHRVGEIRVFECGLPQIDMPFSDNVIDYRRVFGPEGGSYYAVGYDELPRLQALFEVARSRPRIREHALLDNPKIYEERFFQIDIAHLAHGTLDRILHTVGHDYTGDYVREVYSELERGLFLQEAPVELYVPSALTKIVRDDPMQLGPDVRIERIAGGRP